MATSYPCPVPSPFACGFHVIHMLIHCHPWLCNKSRTIDRTPATLNCSSTIITSRSRVDLARMCRCMSKCSRWTRSHQRATCSSIDSTWHLVSTVPCVRSMDGHCCVLRVKMCIASSSMDNSTTPCIDDRSSSAFDSSTPVNSISRVHLSGSGSRHHP
jgi:hypothetical protein